MPRKVECQNGSDPSKAQKTAGKNLKKWVVWVAISFFSSFRFVHVSCCLWPFAFFLASCCFCLLQGPQRTSSSKCPAVIKWKTKLEARWKPKGNTLFGEHKQLNLGKSCCRKMHLNGLQLSRGVRGQSGEMAQSGIPRGGKENSFKAGEKQVHRKRIQALH